MPANPIDVVNEWLQNLLDPDVVNSVVAPDATYVSLNTHDAELNKIMPWAGTSHGPQAFLDNLGAMFTRWENQAFEVTTMFASEENVSREGWDHATGWMRRILADVWKLDLKVVEAEFTLVGVNPALDQFKHLARELREEAEEQARRSGRQLGAALTGATRFQAVTSRDPIRSQGEAA